MASSTHPLDSLLGPLRYACGREFANLRAVRDLKTPLGAALARARGVLSPERLEVLERALPIVDSAVDAQRRRAVLSVLSVLRDEGLKVDFVAPGLLDAVQAAPLSLTPAPLSPPPPKPRTARAGRKAMISTEDPEIDAPARVLSIAPTSGPLATPLKAAGWKTSPRLVGLLNKKGITKMGDVLFLLPRGLRRSPTGQAHRPARGRGAGHHRGRGEAAR